MTKVIIPKIIHLTWKNKSIPDRWKDTIPAWKRLMPGWKIVLWTDKDNREYIQKHHSYFLDVYDGFQYNIQRADAIRYFILRDFGGIYSDMDILPLRNIEQFFEGLSADAILVYSGNVDTYTNSFMASRKGSPFWDLMIEEMMQGQPPWYAVLKHTYIMETTGPGLLNRVAKSYLGTIANLSREVFMAYNIDNHSEHKEHAALRPLEGSSWLNPAEIIIYRILFKVYINRNIIILASIILGFMIYRLSKIKPRVLKRIK
jgi:mannosyltransferase OCH1-like enzyme